MYLLGIDIGGTTCGVCIGDSSGRLIECVQFATRAENGAQQALTAIIAHARRFIQEAPGEIACVGISCGSPVDSRTGVIAFTDQLASWRGLDLKTFIGHTLGLPVSLENDASAGALAEYYYGAGRGFRHLAFLTFGTGLGAGFILNGQLYAGANGYAGEIAHMRLSNSGPRAAGKRGSFEAFCSGHGIAKLARQELPAYKQATLVHPGMSCRDIAEAARDGDAFARHIFDISGRRLGEGLALINDVLNLECIIIGSVFVRCEDLLRPSMERRLSEEAVAASLETLHVVPAQLGEAIGFYAALAAASNALRGAPVHAGLQV